jgi:eukaryotic-like serine/threonine-protein kinase
MVIDFGVAKATHQRLTEKTLFTQFAQMIGTPVYMSPEQADGSQLDIDTRSDIYSLGVLLYELMTGTTPFSEKRLRGLGYAEMQRVLAEEEPPRPSTRLSTLTDRERTELGQRRGEDARTITLLFRHELDWVVMKAIEKDRGRRYETANGLANDVKRYLEGRAIEAAPPSWGYQFHKLAQKHKATFAAAAIIMLVLAGAAAFSTWQAVRATKAEQLAEAKAEEAFLEKATAEAINQWMIEDLLMQSLSQSAQRGQQRGPNLTLANAILTASRNLSERFKDQPVIEGNLHLLVGRTLAELARHEDAVEHLSRAYDLLLVNSGSQHTNTLHAQFVLGWQLAWVNSGSSTGERRQLWEQGRRLMEESVRTTREVLGPEYRETLDKGAQLGIHYANAGDLSLAQGIVPEIVEIVLRIHLDDDPHSVRLRFVSRYALAWLRERQGRHGEARAVYEELLEVEELLRHGSSIVAPYHVEHANLLQTIGSYFWSLDRDFQNARRTLLEGLDISRSIVSDGYPTQNLLRSLSWLHVETGEFETALEYLRQIHDINVRRLGHAHPWTRGSGRQIAAVHARFGDWRAVVDELQAQRDQGTSDAFSLAQALLAETLAGQMNTIASLRQNLWKTVQEHPAESAMYQSALILLTLVPSEDELPGVLELARLAEEDKGTVWWGSFRKPLLQGLAAHRNGQFAEAIRILDPLTRGDSPSKVTGDSGGQWRVGGLGRV